MCDLTFAALRGANIARLPQFRNARGEIANAMPDGSDWSLSDWYTAMSGEAGEAGNVLTKIRRGDFTLEAARPKLASEFADVVIYLDILAKQAGIDLGEAVRDKFNEVSNRVGSTVMLRGES